MDEYTKRLVALRVRDFERAVDDALDELDRWLEPDQARLARDEYAREAHKRLHKTFFHVLGS